MSRERCIAGNNCTEAAEIETADGIDYIRPSLTFGVVSDSSER